MDINNYPFLKKLKNNEIKEQIKKVVDFHGCLSPGALIGVYMFNMAKSILNIGNGERIYATCETYNCLPDAFQVLGRCTIGNKRLKIKDTGKMAVIVNKMGKEGETIKGVRIILDDKKTVNYPALHAWYMNTKKIPHDNVILDIVNAGESVYSYEFLAVEVPYKPKKRIELCNICQEPFISYNGEKICPSCK
ncbi:FmdE family protein [Methanothermococcus okinawensis]|uniref:Formylmethanofuran dehydrogenase subunit E region n=1 Tax=Methanothermococcus okinawensis (strain DSM 14208 / JCM 11175 / IH1) TaxID=647113 RepID=F8ANZ9_METOI|nr:FmdE family protein [Methanothermococcus okinawensis]AEH07143.1 formylmethanofuran dehydrogenase subunit E region [Methanothermococcus okinawensis IH1]